MSEFQIKQQQLTEHRVVNTPLVEHIEAGQVVLKVERFSFSANNITYAMMGEKLGYWQFFPAADNADKQWGIIPVWGIAKVTHSKNPDVSVGERLFGYFPPGEQLVITPEKITPERLFDGAAHRAQLPAGYNAYSRLNAEKNYDPQFDNERILLFALHITSFCLWDRLQDNDWFAAKQVIVISASSKTSLGLGYALQADEHAPHSIGLTSTGNRSFVQGLAVYNQVFDYTQIKEIDPTVATVIVDMSGSSEILATLNAHLGDSLQYCINVGLTHWDAFSTHSSAESTTSEFFFAPGHIQKRIKEWGALEFHTRSTRFMTKTAMQCRDWLDVNELTGLAGLAQVYPQIYQGGLPPQQGVVIKF